MHFSTSRRRTTLALLAGTLAGSLASAGCSTTASPGSGSNPGGGPGPSGGSTPLLGSLKPAANDPKVTSPFDATPDLDGKNVYFTAIGARGAGVFKVAAGGGPITTVFEGAPFVSPLSIAITEDGKHLLVADLGAASAKADDGVIFSLGIGGGKPEDLTDADGMIPRGLEVAGDTLYFTGTAKGGKPGLFAMPVGGGAVRTLAEGAPFHDPSGVAISETGDAYVVDTHAGGSNTASIVKVSSSGKASVFLSGLMVGYPAGIVFDASASALLVSALDPAKGTDAVVVVDLAKGTQRLFTTGIDTFLEPAGLHRAHQAEVFAWADSKANHTGTVYVITR